MSRPEASFLPFARALKPRVSVPVIAVGRLGDPELAAAAVAEGACDFVALGRPLLADENWVAKAQAGEPVRRCLACNTCINIMREGSRLACLVNARTGREREFAQSGDFAIRGKRIAVIGAGPAGLTFASLVAPGNEVVVFERQARAGGSLRQAALAPRFQDVEAAPAAFDKYLASLVRACETAGAQLKLGIDVTRSPEQLAGFDLIVVATGAVYHAGLGWPAKLLLSSGAARWPGIREVFNRPAVRDWLYYRARRATGAEVARLAKVGQEVIVIGDAAKAGKSQAAIAQAFEAALLGRHRIASQA